MKPNNVQASYDRWSSTYDTQDNPTRDLDAIVLPSLIPNLADKTVVEIGCGTGKNTLWLAPQCKQLIGLDFSSGMLALAQQKVDAANVQLIRANIVYPLPLINTIADVVLFNLILEHIEDLASLFQEAARVMKSGATLIISELHPTRLQRGSGAIIAADGDETKIIDNFVHSIADFQTALQAADLEVISMNDWYHPELPREAGKDPLLMTFQAHKP